MPSGFKSLPRHLLVIYGRRSSKVESSNRHVRPIAAIGGKNAIVYCPPLIL